MLVITNYKKSIVEYMEYLLLAFTEIRYLKYDFNLQYSCDIPLAALKNSRPTKYLYYKSLKCYKEREEEGLERRAHKQRTQRSEDKGRSRIPLEL